MWNNHIKLAWRNLLHNKLYSIINLVGFSMALAVVFILLVYVSNENNYDKSMLNYRNCYRLLSHLKDGSYKVPNIPYPLTEEIQSNFPEVETVAMFQNNPKLQVKTHQYYNTEDEFHSVSNKFFGMLKTEIIEGNPLNPLPDSHSIVLSQKIAKKYFAEGAALGKKITIKNRKFIKDLTVTGIIKDLPQNLTYRAEAYLHMDLSFDLLLGNMITYGSTPKRQNLLENWNFPTTTLLLMLSQGSDPSSLERKINNHLLKLRGKEYYFEHKIQPIVDVHLNSNNLHNLHKSPGNKKLLILQLTIAFLILMVASINYVILNTATSLKRTKEFGLRKVLGAHRSALRKQLLIESILLSLISLPLALTIAELISPKLQEIFGLKITFHYENNILVITLFILLTLFAGVLSGSYLSVLLTKVETLELLKSKKLNLKTHKTIRDGLIMVQMIIFISLIICSLFIREQLNYISIKDMGYNKKALLIVPLRGTEMEREYSWLKDQISKSPMIERVSGAMSCPPLSFTMQMNIPNPSQPDEDISLQFIVADEDFISTMGIKMVAGHSFTSDRSFNQSGVILNETAVKLMKFDNPIGQKTSLGDIIGVVKDFHPTGLTKEIPPTCIQMVNKANIKSQIKDIVIRTHPEKVNEAMNLIRNIWRERASEMDLKIQMPDERLSNIYQKEQKFSKLFQTYTFMAILIATLGLFGFSLFIAEQHTKEIGIRKVMGANMIQIFLNLCRGYAKLLILAFIIAAPTSWFFMQKILDNYVYRAPLNLVYFALALIAASLIIILSISGNIWKAAIQNPVKCLKYE